mgnify:CR=1 FL=1
MKYKNIVIKIQLNKYNPHHFYKIKTLFVSTIKTESTCPRDLIDHPNI